MSDPSLIPNTQNSHTPQQINQKPDSNPWIQHYEEGVPAHLTVPEHPLTWLLDTTSSRYPNQVAFLYYGTRITYAQFSHQANRFAIALQHLGIQKGDRVAIALPNIPQFPIAFYGALRAGAVVVPTNPLYTEREMQHQLADSGAKIIVTLDMCYPIVRSVYDQTALEHIIVASPADFLPLLKQKLYGISQQMQKKGPPPVSKKELDADPHVLQMKPMLKTQSKGGIELFNLPIQMNGDDLAVLQYTGGTTGLAKGAMLTHRNLLANALQTRLWEPSVKDAQATALCVAPFFHAYGLTVAMNLSIYAAATMVLLPRFQANEVLNTIHSYRPNLLPGIPTMYIALMKEAGKHPEYLESVKYCISGAAPLPAKVQQDFEAITGGKVVEGYGLSEAAPVTHCNPLTDKCRNGSIGLPLPGIEARIISQETGEPLPAAEIGEIVVRGPNVMKGYWKRDDETQAIFIDGWMRTGDIGKMDEDGYFYVVERAKDLIIASGFNVYPREVEEVLYHHPAIQEVSVVGTPDAYRGETVTAFIVLKPGFSPGEEIQQDIVNYSKQQLAAYKVPKKVEFRNSLPKSLVGKTLRRELRKQIQGHE